MMVYPLGALSRTHHGHLRRVGTKGRLGWGTPPIRRPYVCLRREPRQLYGTIVGNPTSRKFSEKTSPMGVEMSQILDTSDWRPKSLFIASRTACRAHQGPIRSRIAYEPMSCGVRVIDLTVDRRGDKRPATCPYPTSSMQPSPASQKNPRAPMQQVAPDEVVSRWPLARSTSSSSG